MPAAAPIISGLATFGGSLASGALLSTAIIAGLAPRVLETVVDGKAKP